MATQFLDNIYKGRSDAWSCLIVLGVAQLYWQLFAYFTVVVIAALLSALSVSPVLVEVISRNAPFAVVLGWMAFAIRFFHGRSLLTLVNTEPSINFKRIAQGFLMWGGLILFWLLFDIWLNPEHYVWQFDLVQWLPLLIASLLLVPIQTSIEELIFRGYIMQALRPLTSYSLIIVIISAGLFSSAHWGNPEMLRGDFIWGALNYFAWGVIFSVVTLKDNGLELALGIHAANNIVGSIMLAVPDSVLQTPAMFGYVAPIDPILSLLSLIIDGVIFYWAFFGGIPRRQVNLSEEA